MYFKDFCIKKSKTLIMGILNVTPDSFFDGNIHYNKNLNDIFKKLNKCDIIDIGAESSRPGAEPISIDEEKNRLSQVLKHIKHTDKYISIDTYKPEVAAFCLNNGFNMVNDISGGRNIKMLEVVSDFNVPLVLMHMKGNPKNMQKDTKYTNIIEDIKSYFDKQLNLAVKYGINVRNLILDPGIGFGKSIKQNDDIIKNLKEFKSFDIPILIGLSRKSFLTYKNNKPENRLESTLAITALAINNGADIIRVHDIDKSIEVLSVIDRILKN